MKNGLISKSVILSFIGVILSITMFVGTTLAVFNITISSTGNKVITSAAGVTFKVNDEYTTDVTEGTNLSGNKVFNDVSLSPGNITSTRYITIYNGSSSQIRVDVKISDIDVATPGNWKLYSKIISSDANPQDPAEISFTNQNSNYKSFTDINNSDFLVGSNSQTLNASQSIIIAVAIKLESVSTATDDSISFTISVNAVEQ